MTEEYTQSQIEGIRKFISRNANILREKGDDIGERTLLRLLQDIS